MSKNPSFSGRIQGQKFCPFESYRDLHCLYSLHHWLYHLSLPLASGRLYRHHRHSGLGPRKSIGQSDSIRLSHTSTWPSTHLAEQTLPNMSTLLHLCLPHPILNKKERCCCGQRPRRVVVTTFMIKNRQLPAALPICTILTSSAL